MLRILLVCLIQVIVAGSHRLWFSAIAISKGTNLPQFIDISMINDVQHTYYDSSMEKPVVRAEWVNDILRTEFWDRQSWLILSCQPRIRWSLKLAEEHFNHTGTHTYQITGGCEIHENGTRDSHLFHAYDGKDFVSFDVNTLSWIAIVPQANFYKRIREADNKRRVVENDFYRTVCFDWLKRLIHHGRKHLERKVRPDMAVIWKKNLNSEIHLICHVTGFYPYEIDVKWIREGGGSLSKKDVWHGDVLPNGDGTYQQRKTLRLSAKEQDKYKYACHVQHVSLEEVKVLRWEPPLNSGFTKGPTMVMIMALGALMSAVIVATIKCAWRIKQRQGCPRVCDSELS
uniref:Major histocompatibility complex class I-related gene protein-like n=1 Tax=Erpetoichthys calabaricus TaxID=27687 RepID=A0A8C4XB29_ERPCA